ncbi:MAG TPA: NUDIX domain-containing protein [Pseudomonadales bacterium]|nr:NUDIX domain-containing protein [Pseudomonadales bacterium]
MLPASQFSAAVEALPLVSIDLCLIDTQQRILLGKRLNRPAQGWWFTPGGRIRKNEAWQDAFKRIAQDELGLEGDALQGAQLMGIWDHFYEDSALNPNISTHYVNLPHLIYLTASQVENMTLPTGDQHRHYCWMELQQAADHVDVHPYVQTYAQWIKER